jgi:predicted RNA binding protein YcfA (HicA-like mRNA interferase family)
VSRRQKLLLKILSGTADSNINFEATCNLLIDLGFDQRIKGSHHIFSKTSIPEIINIQPLGANCKAYQVKQIRALLTQYKLASDLSDGEPI